MAEKKQKQKNTFQKTEDMSFSIKDDSGFQKGGNAVYQARDGNAKKEGQEHEQGRKKQRNQSEFLDVENKIASSKAAPDIATKSEENTFGQNVQKSNAEPGNGETSDFISNENVFSEQTNSVAKAQISRATKTGAKKRYQKTFGQNVQKSDAEPEKKETFNFIKNDNVFSEQDFTEQQENIEQKQNFTGQYEKTEPKQSFTEDYHQRDTYRQSAKKKKYHRKRIKKEHQSKQQESKGKDFGEFQTKDTTFTENEDSSFVESKKLQKKRKQAQKAGEKTEKARAKLPKKKEYTLQRVYDEETGRGRYVVVPIEKEKTFKPDGFPKSAMKRLENEGKNFVHGKIAENEKENSAVEAAHKTEQKVEDFYGFVKRQYKGKAQRQRAKVAKLEKKQFQKEVNFQYQKFLEENPQMKKKALQKRLQKQRIKREYMKAKRNGAATKSAKKAVAKTADTAAKVARK